MDIQIPQVVIIYGLCDPRTGHLRYVGKANNVKHRLNAHCCESSNHGTHKLHWIRQLKNLGIRPEIIELEIVPVGRWEESERFWIQYMRFIGCNLTNAGDGGHGQSNLTPETRQRISSSRKGKVLSESHRLNLSISHLGQRPKNLDQLAAISKLPKSENHKKAISDGLRGHIVTDESRKRMSEAAKRRHAKNKQDIRLRPECPAGLMALMD